MDIAAYLKRINYRGTLEPTAETLRSLHRAHMLAVPLENLDYQLGRRIILNDSHLFAKIVGDRRGGVCYELNGLFSALLAELGFKVELLSAGGAREEGGFDPPFDHLALLVSLDQRWLADIGFGDSFREPLLLDEPGEQERDGDLYRIIRGSEYLILQQRRQPAPWKNLYNFTLEPYRYADFAEMCRFQQTSPQSPYTQRRVCTMATPDGRVTLLNMQLKITVRGEHTVRLLESEEEYRVALYQYFGITLGELKFNTELILDTKSRLTHQ